MDETVDSVSPAPAASRPVRWIARWVVTPFGLRHVRGIAVIRYLVAGWLVLLGSVVCVLGYWWGALLFPTAAAVGALAYWVPRSRVRLEAEKRHVQRLRELERSRTVAVDDAAARLRRIEQDLHDGAQAQMVAVVMKLGLARESLGDAAAGSGRPDLQRALELVDAARRGAIEAINELRDLAHGIYPHALNDGLGSALGALAARSDVPVDVNVDLTRRPPAAIETIAYFCTAELLTNAIKHGGARHVTVEASQRPGMITVRVEDDGSGGARIGARGGLAGLAERVTTVDGRLHIDSPPCGPTVVTVELPSQA